MTVQKIVEDAIAPTGINASYRKFDKIPDGNYITWYIDRAAITGSDDGRYHIKSADVVVELYTAGKDYAAEQSIENAFAPYNLEIREEYDERENLYQITYSFTVTVKIKN